MKYKVSLCVWFVIVLLYSSNVKKRKDSIKAYTLWLNIKLKKKKNNCLRNVNFCLWHLFSQSLQKKGRIEKRFNNITVQKYNNK